MKIALIGYGKMGKTIEQLILDQYKEDEIVLRISDENKADFTIQNLQKADVAIEFTQPDSAIGNIYTCFEAGVPVVVGTTAWLEKLDEVKRVCAEKKGSLFYAPNFSIGVNIFFELNKKMAAIMQHQPQYQAALEEIHHTEKKDAPSGTAIKTAEMILENWHQKTSWQLSGVEPKNPNALLITAKREEHVPGTHTVTYQSDVDELVFTHQAKSRKGFAQGAIVAAHWLVGKKGVFDMSDMLEF